MRVDAARAAAVDWVERRAASVSGFVGAYFSGSIVYLPHDAEVPVGSDVDVMVVTEREEATHRRKFLQGGALIETSYLPWSLFTSLDTVPSAHSLRFDSLIADPGGRLSRLRAAVVRHYAEPSHVWRRCRRLWDETGRQCASSTRPHPGRST